RIAAALLGLNQRLTDAPIHPHLVVDRLAGSLELLLMLVLVLLHCARSSLTLTRAVQRPAMLQCTRAG
ncbi:hypothetical protein A3V19_23125, partial [Salmonella enterica subsp. enterica serovar Enteritidis]|nr:hypothetical protein [Salmonella enterica subsp. enterica serovar Enteritidis]